ncbi:DUF2393 domain-containing protein [Sulfurimonas sp. C5]|uniref:DUF2393 domain-containing protein n=1 Tax=Sulfurimonas sp. C5 TaxID=3036947 RepID=UPI002456560A|nr:DUF2393 domain-containing protein [Sulfurimonas sp. C5]MDH4944515.1 DUF2393 domain-containing protein [Sulfurimonas sp. C5]
MRSSKFQNFVDGLVTQDFILFGSILVLFILLIVLALFMREKLKTAIFLVLLAFTIVVLGPSYGYIKLHEYIFKNKVEFLSQKKLNFVEAVVVKGKVTNISTRDFRECRVSAYVFKASSNKFKNYIYGLKPLQKMSIDIDGLLQNETKEFKIIVEPFKYEYNYNISLEADCQ